MEIIRGGQMNNKIKFLQLFNFVFSILGFNNKGLSISAFLDGADCYSKVVGHHSA